MFDSVGKSRKQDPVRAASSMLLSLLMNGGFIGGLWYLGSKVVEEVQKEEAVEVTFFDQAPPPPPPPPPPSSAPKPKNPKPKAPDTEPEPVPLPEEIPEPPPEEPEEEAGGGDPNATGQPCGGPGQPPCGPPCGGPGQPECGPPCGGPGQPECGPPCGLPGLPPCASGPRAVHWSEVKAKTRVSPPFPEAARQLGLTEERCQLDLYIDEKGKVYDVKPKNCPKVFEEEALKAAWQWKFYPYKVDGRAEKATFTLTFKFVLN